MNTLTSSTPAPTAATTFRTALRRLYLVRFVFAIVWTGLVFASSSLAGPLLTVLLVAYPLFDAAAVLWQIRSNPEPQRSNIAEWINVIASVVVAVALGIASTISIAAALAVWGAWAIGAGVPQLIAAIRNRHSGGQVPQMLSGGISVLAGTAFLLQGLQGATAIAGVAGYALLGAIFFVVSAIRLSILMRANA